MGETDEKETTPTEAAPTNEVEEPKETEKLLNKDDKKLETGDATNIDDKKIDEAADKKQVANGDEIIDIPEKTPTTQEGREVKPKKIPIGGIKMPGFFTRNKPKTDGDGADGELLENAGNEAKVEQQEKVEKEPRPNFFTSLKFKNPFAKKPTAEKAEEQAKKEEKVEEEPADVTKPQDEKEGKADEPPKRCLLNAIRLPIANLPRKLRSFRENRDEDVEMGNGPNNKAGLASMETLDDSLKDTDGKDVTDKAAAVENDSLETVKLTADGEKEKANEKNDEAVPVTEKTTIVERIRRYQCSYDDLAIVGGLLLFFILVILIFAFTLVGNSELTSAPVRDGKFIQAATSCGMVEGILEDSSFAFRGIPYAIPPIGENRWKPAQVIDSVDGCWNGTFKAHNATPVCWQIYANGTIDGVEDCLKLDVITPHVRYDNPLPVVVLVGAESFTGNSPNILRPSARYARARDVVFVRPNFRVGVFGFLALDVLSKSTHPPTSGNYGLSDILAVLKWVNLNIHHFGGNPSQITLFGHRAGATIVSALVTSPQAKNLFEKVWVTSGSAIFPGKPLIESERSNAVYLDQVKCKDAECLRNTEDEELLDAVPDTWRRVWADLPTAAENVSLKHEWLVLDGQILQQHPAGVWNNEAVELPKMVIGTTAHESHSEKLFLKHKEWTPELVKEHIQNSIIGEKGLVDEVLKLYNATYEGLVSMISDIRTICPLLTISQLQHSVFYVVGQRSGELNLASVDDDVQAILGRYEPKSPEQRRYVSAIQQLFYHYVSFGQVKPLSHFQRVLYIEQDPLPMREYRHCDFWISNDIVPRYARLD
ncbi:Neurotactin [Pseudolycoriella hygida]|uniref:Neurotactin n=1 Tax=Pseudolycoriella hygida TaxID=35572 RepID=A0A9Q0MRK3_9DIPT|nr:Neurotactin [Pseudolycoriella hygida]